MKCVNRNINDFDEQDKEFVKQLRLGAERLISDKRDQNYAIRLESSIDSKTRFVPTEDDTVKLIKNMQNRNVKVIALTAAKTGVFGVIDNLGEWRLKNLASIGLDFSSSFNIQEIIFDKLKKSNFSGYPEYYKGILMAANNPKGKVLASFLDKNDDWKPDKIIFLDDSYNNCKNVDEAMKQLGIPIQCYCYRAAFKNKIKLNQKVIRYQFDHWIKHEEFLTEQKALEKIDNEPAYIIYDFEKEQVIKDDGDIQTQESPCSTFKIALSLMGFDSGILKNENAPEWHYKDEYNAEFDFWRCAQTPKSWIKKSCIWYSQVLTSILGPEKFQNHVNSFCYGNKDGSGNPGKNDGLSRSWLCSNLKISPTEQIEFLKNLLKKTLPVSEYAHEQTQNILYISDLTDGWKLYGKTGAGIYEGGIKSIGWFIGWITNKQIKKTLIFAYLIKSNNDKIVVNGNLAKENILKILTEGCHANC